MAGKRRRAAVPASIQRWEAMDHEEQLAVVREVCGSKGRMLIQRFDGTLAVGAGFKKSANEISDRICLGLLVGKKGVEDVTRPVPERIGVYVIRGGKRILLSIPTDVEELGYGEPQAAVNLALGLRAFNKNNPAQGILGAACCIVADTNNPPNHFILGCRHVLALSLLTTGCAAFNATDVADPAMQSRVADLFFSLPMAANGQPCLDAALAIIPPGTQVGWMAAGGTRQIAVEPGVQRPLQCNVYSPRGPIPAGFVKEWANLPLPYPNCGQVVIAAAYQFQAATQGGDSGSPVMTAQGLLHGMHIWGDPAQQLAIAIPAFVLFRPGLFPVNIRLA